MAALGEWVDDSRCRDYDPRLWDTSKVRNVTHVTRKTIRAKDICLDCPVMMDCLIHGVVYAKQDQVWGGLTDEERDEWASREGLAAALASR